MTFSPVAVVCRSDSRQYRLVGAHLIRFVASWSLRDWGVALVAVFASLLLTPRAAEATCGDYLRVGGGSVMQVHSMPNQPISTSGSLDFAADPAVPHRPCHGPSCSGGSFPPPAPATSVVVSIERWALAPADPAPSFVCSDYLLAVPFDLVVDGSALSILRPPS